jgi:glutamyl-tRNA reductase
MFTYDIDDLQQVADANLKKRRKEAEQAEEIVEEEVEKLMQRLRAHHVGPTIVSLQKRLETMRLAEIERHRSKFGELTAEQEQAIEALTRGLMNKIAHSPITHMREMAGHPDGGRVVEFVKRAFGLRNS